MSIGTALDSVQIKSANRKKYLIDKQLTFWFFENKCQINLFVYYQCKISSKFFFFLINLKSIRVIVCEVNYNHCKELQIYTFFFIQNKEKNDNNDKMKVYCLYHPQ